MRLVRRDRTMGGHGSCQVKLGSAPLKLQHFEHRLVEGTLVVLDGVTPPRLLEQELHEEAPARRVPHEDHAVVQGLRRADVSKRHVGQCCSIVEVGQGRHGQGDVPALRHDELVRVSDQKIVEQRQLTPRREPAQPVQGQTQGANLLVVGVEDKLEAMPDRVAAPQVDEGLVGPQSLRVGRQQHADARPPLPAATAPHGPLLRSEAELLVAVLGGGQPQFSQLLLPCLRAPQPPRIHRIAQVRVRQHHRRRHL
mmetsp:Transcript_35649/g.95023  ORF Transcript_35649/g.95023 Transcript_35649/m.95023 type:complete len:253 (+) Transcript_35649:594-1352(+)